MKADKDSSTWPSRPSAENNSSNWSAFRLGLLAPYPPIRRFPLRPIPFGLPPLSTPYSPDGSEFVVAPGWGPTSRTFHVVEIPLPLAVISVGAPNPLNEPERAQIETLLADHVTHVAFLSQDRSGNGVVEGRGPPRMLATAAAALKAIGGWDESVPISIEVNGQAIEVRLQFDGRRWSAEATEVSA